jgi:magnesium chelatase family protein
LTVKEKAFLEMVADRYALSGRGIISTLAVARTIADLDEQEKVLQEHLIEAIGYRPRGDQRASVKLHTRITKAMI